MLGFLGPNTSYPSSITSWAEELGLPFAVALERKARVPSGVRRGSLSHCSGAGERRRHQAQSPWGWALARAVQHQLQNMKLGWTSLVSGFTSCSGLQPGSLSPAWGILRGDFQQFWQCLWSLAGFVFILQRFVSGNQPIESAASVKQHQSNKFLAIIKQKKPLKPAS